MRRRRVEWTCNAEAPPALGADGEVIVRRCVGFKRHPGQRHGYQRIDPGRHWVRVGAEVTSADEAEFKRLREKEER